MTVPTLFPNEVQYPSGFEEFYQEFPRRVGKLDAMKAYRQAIRHGATHAVLMRAVLRYAAERDGKDPTFTKTPGPWLRAGRWLDDPAPIVSTRATVFDVIVEGERR